MVIASGRSSRQVASISEHLTERLKEAGTLSKVEGAEQGDWVLIDAGDVIVHVFRPEVREFYQLEKMWMPTGLRRPEQCRGGRRAGVRSASALAPALRLLICAVGRLKPCPERALVDDYAARLARAGRMVSLGPLEIKEIEARGGPEAEAALLERAVPEGGRVVVLDERGRALTSPGLAETLACWRDDGARDAAFLIGGADGLGPGLRERADAVLSLGPMVWPHRLARAMLAEQLYRATSILAGTPYHRA